MKLILLIFIVFLSHVSCESTDPEDDIIVNPPAQLPFDDVSNSRLPSGDLNGLSMDADFIDYDGDGDLDIIIASEFANNILLENDGNANFTNVSSGRLPSSQRDSEDIAVADFDGDGDPDILIVSEDDEINELYFNNANGTFTDVSNRIVPRGVSNAVEVFDANGDGSPDILIGNNGQNFLLINRGNGLFDDETITRLPSVADVTQDLILGDIDRDGDVDFIAANEDRNRVYINNGSGVFSDETNQRLPTRGYPEMTREAILGDVDLDGDFDLYFANVTFTGIDSLRQNRLLLNDGTGVFVDVTTDSLPVDTDRSFTAKFVDIDSDQDLDIITGNINTPNLDGFTPYRVYVGNGTGSFTEATDEFFPNSVTGRGFDIEIADLNADGLLDIFLCSRGSSDILLLGDD